MPSYPDQDAQHKELPTSDDSADEKEEEESEHTESVENFPSFAAKGAEANTQTKEVWIIKWCNRVTFVSMW